VAIAAREYNLTLGVNTAAMAQSQRVSVSANTDLTVTLYGCDLNGDPLRFRITALPTTGALYQVKDGSRAGPITAFNTSVADLLGRVIFRPAPDEFGESHASFSFTAHDGESDSAPANITISVTPLSLAPEISMAGWSTDNSFTLLFTGWSASTYRIWGSTNLLEWRVLGSAMQKEPGTFEFVDPATSDPARFYKVTSP
jgi:hypothetical protein